MRAKKANLAVHISPAKRGSLKGYEREKEQVLFKRFTITVTAL